MFLRGNISRGDYTVYKNRLTNAIRRTKALYYSKLFYENAKKPETAMVNHKWNLKQEK